jgi:hypothetical protein
MIKWVLVVALRSQSAWMFDVWHYDVKEASPAELPSWN